MNLPLRFRMWLASLLLKPEMPITSNYYNLSICFSASKKVKEEVVGIEMGDCGEWKKACNCNVAELDQVRAFISQDLNESTWNPETQKYESLRDTLKRLFKRRQ